MCLRDSPLYFSGSYEPDRRSEMPSTGRQLGDKGSVVRRRQALALHGQEPRLQIEQLELDHGAASLQMAGRFGPEWQLDMEAHTDKFTPADLDSAAPGGTGGPQKEVTKCLLR